MRSGLLIRRHLGWSLPLLWLGLALFARDMGHISLWQDEGWGIFASQLPDLPAIMEFAVIDSHPPGFPILLHGWGRLVGDHILLLRALNLFASVLGLAISYRLALDCFGLRAAIGAALIVATSDLVIALTPAARHYGFFLLFSAASAWAYWRYSRRWHWGWGLAFAASGILMLSMIYWGAFVLLALGLHFLAYHWRRWRAFAPPVAAIAAFFLLLIPGLLRGADAAYADSSGGFHSATALNRDGAEVLLFQFLGEPEALFALLALAGIPASLHGRRYLPDERSALMALWLLVPILLPLLISLLAYNIMIERPLIAMIPPLGILIGHVLAQMRRWEYALLLTLILVNNFSSTGSTHRGGGPWWEMAELLQRYSSPNDALLIEADFHAYAIQVHAAWADVPIRNVIRARQFTENWSGEQRQDVPALIQQHEVVWLVDTNPVRDYVPILESLGYQRSSPVIDLAPFQHYRTRMLRYARPPEGEPLAVYGDTLQLRQLESQQQGCTLHVDLSWTAAQAPPVDYSISVFLLGADGRMMAQHDSYPLDNRLPTSTWQPGGLYFDRHSLDTCALPPDDYTLGVRVYTWWDGAVLPLTACSTACDFYRVEPFPLR